MGLNFFKVSYMHQRVKICWNILFGLGVSKLMFGGMIFFSSARVVLMRPTSPDAPSAWPRFGFTYSLIVSGDTYAHRVSNTYRSDI